jgi:hypothetical protein
MGVQLEGGGHLVEDNRLDFNRHIGVLVSGDGSTVRRNRIFSTGGGTTGMGSAGIHASYGVDVIDNLVSGVETLPATPLYAIGIFSNGNVGGVIEGNRIRGLAGGASGQTVGIDAQGSDAMSLRANTLSATDGAGIGLQCQSTDSFADGNHVVGFGTASAGCTSGDAEPGSPPCASPPPPSSRSACWPRSPPSPPPPVPSTACRSRRCPRR